MPHVRLNLCLLHTVAASVLSAAAGMLLSDATSPSISRLAIALLAVALLAGSKFLISGSVTAPSLAPTRIPRMNIWLLSQALLAWSILLLLVFVNVLAAVIMALAIPLLWLSAWRSGQRDSRIWQFVEGGIFALPAFTGGAAAAQDFSVPVLIVATLMLHWALTYAQVNMLSRAGDTASKSVALSRTRVRADWQLALRLAQLAVWTLLPVILFPLVMSVQRLGIMYLIVALGLAVSLVFIGFEPVLGLGRLRHARLVEVFNLYPLLLMSALILDRLPQMAW